MNDFLSLFSPFFFVFSTFFIVAALFIFSLNETLFIRVFPNLPKQLRLRLFFAETGLSLLQNFPPPNFK